MGKAGVLRDLMPLIPLIYEGLDAATQRASQFFAEQNRAIDPYFASSYVRWAFKDYLLDKGKVLADYEPEELPNIGLSFRYKQYHIRIWKTSTGEVPHAGSSKRKLAFLTQNHTQLRFPWADQVQLNLVILWSVDADYHLRQIFVACPKGDLTGSIEWEWIEPIDPAMALRFEPIVDDVYNLDLDFEIYEAEDYQAKDEQG